MKDSEKLYQHIGTQIANKRKEKGLSQTDLAVKIGLSRGSIANIEKGRQQAPIHVIWQIAVILEAPIETILPIQNEHITLNRSEIIEQIDNLSELNSDEKVLINRFIQENL